MRFMQRFVTILVIVLSIISLVIIMLGGYHDKQYKSLAVWATFALLLMFAGAIGINIVLRNIVTI